MDFRLLFNQTCEDIVKRPLYLISAKITRLVTKISLPVFQGSSLLMFSSKEKERSKYCLEYLRIRITAAVLDMQN